MAKERPRVELGDGVDLVLQDGSEMRVRPGPYGKGIAVVPLSGPGGPREGSGQRGRKPRPGTVKLRQRLAKDAAKGDVREAAHYVKWMMKQDPEVGLTTARQIVYRERRAALQ